MCSFLTELRLLARVLLLIFNEEKIHNKGKTMTKTHQENTDQHTHDDDPFGGPEPEGPCGPICEVACGCYLYKKNKKNN